MGHVLLLYLRNSTQGHTFSLVFSPRSCIDLGFQLGLWSVLSKTFCLVWGVGPSFVLFACVCLVTQVLSNSLRPHGLWPTRLLCPWDFLGKNTGVCCHALLQGIFPTQGWNQNLLHCGQILYHWAILGSLYAYGYPIVLAPFVEKIRKKEKSASKTHWRITKDLRLPEIEQISETMKARRKWDRNF